MDDYISDFGDGDEGRETPMRMQLIDDIEEDYELEWEELWEKHCALLDFQRDHPFNEFIEKAASALCLACPKIKHIIITDKIRSFSAEQSATPIESSNALLITVKAATQSRRRLHSITGIRLHELIFMRDEDFETVQPAIASLRSLRLHTYEGNSRAAGTVLNPAIMNLLTASTFLTELKLASGSGYPLPPSYSHSLKRLFNLGQTISNITWPHLKTVYLSSFFSTERELVNLVLRHSDTLESLGLGLACLTEGNWTSTFKTLAGKLPSLKHSYFTANLLTGDNQTIPTAGPQESVEYWFFRRVDVEYRTYMHIPRLGQLVHMQLTGNVTDAQMEELESLKAGLAARHAPGQQPSISLADDGINGYLRVQGDEVDVAEKFDEYDEHFELSYKRFT